MIEAVATVGRAETKKEIARAKEAFTVWKKTPGPKSGGYLAETARPMRERKDERAETITN